jgi:hypothetical protein
MKNLFKLCAVAAAACAMSLSASAMTSIQDEELSQVSGQDGVSIAADLKINIGSFTYTDTDANGGSVSMRNINVSGLFLTTIDILSNTAFQGALLASVSSYDAANTVANMTALAASGQAPAGDVVQIAFPNVGVTHSLAPSVSVGAITMGNSTASYGSMAINNIDLQGTKVWIWAH